MKGEVIAFTEVQGNVLLPYTRANCARMMFFRFDGAQLEAARAWIAEIAQRVTFHDAVRDPSQVCIEGDGPHLNIAFTFEGLQALDYDPFTLEYLPEEFQQGMRARAERLGDVFDAPGFEPRVHAILMIYVHDEEVARHGREVGTRVHRWDELADDAVKDLEYAVYRAMEAPVAGLPTSPAVVHLAALDQDTYMLDAPGVPGVEYFGFRDGLSQPRIAGATDDGLDADSPPGTVLLGFPPPTMDGGEPRRGAEETRGEVASRHLQHGSMLVVRRLRQDVEGFRRQAELQSAGVGGLEPRALAELMMGRRMNGDALVAAGLEGYGSDPEGRGCPFQAHVRRANPRNAEARIRRIMRRAMPYSRLRQRESGKGLMFLAYNAQIESQFEFVQRLWINSGVENHGLSRDRDPIAGEPPDPAGSEVGKGSFSFTSPVDAQPYTLTGIQSHVTFEWGDYFLAPSRKTLEELSASPASPLTELRRRLADEPRLRLRRDILGRWLDDPDVGVRIWREVRESGGVVRLPEEHVVLAGSEDVVAAVLHDDGSRYSVEQQGDRMRQTTGDFYLGMDASSEAYRRESAVSERIIPGWGTACAMYGARRSDAADDPAQAAAAEALAAKQQAELGDVAKATAELCVTFIGLAVTEAVANHDRPGRPSRGELDLAKYTAFVLSGLTPKIFGVPQPSAAASLALNVPHSGYIFFPFPEERFLEYAEQAARGISAYYSQLFEQRERRERNSQFPPVAEALDQQQADAAERRRAEEADRSWQHRLDETLSALEGVCRERRARGEAVHWIKEDSIRTMAGVISGMLVASFKLFVDGVSEYAKEFEVGSPISVDPAAMARLPFDTMRARQRSMPNILYRVAKDEHVLGGQPVSEGDFVLVCQGSAMADSDGEWFYGDRTPEGHARPESPHFCPGYLMADTMLQTMSQMLFQGCSDLRRRDHTGAVLDFDWAKTGHFVETMKRLAASGSHGE